tara:strand:+ start:256 stop:531 length:276 start_codon:yes stop_codon:yes gene_type:complete
MINPFTFDKNTNKLSVTEFGNTFTVEMPDYVSDVIEVHYPWVHAMNKNRVTLIKLHVVFLQYTDADVLAETVIVTMILDTDAKFFECGHLG